MTTRHAGCRSRIVAAASTPSPPGMRTSMSTTSGASDAQAATAAGPSAAVPTTVDPRFEPEQRRDAVPDQLLVVDDEHPHVVGHRRAGSRLGTRTVTAVPVAGR